MNIVKMTAGNQKLVGVKVETLSPEAMARLKRVFPFARTYNVKGAGQVFTVNASERAKLEAELARFEPITLDLAAMSRKEVEEWADANLNSYDAELRFRELARQLRVTKNRTDVRPSESAERLAAMLATGVSLVELEQWLAR